MKSLSFRKLPRPKLTYTIKEKRDSERKKPVKYHARLSFWTGSLKRMIKVRQERIKQVEKEKTDIENQIRKLKKELDKRSDYQKELKSDILDIERELNIYRDYLKGLQDGDWLERRKSYYIKKQKHKNGQYYYIGRVRFFQYKGSKRREKYHYFGNVYELNRQYGKGIPREEVEDYVKGRLKEELIEMFENEFF